MKTKIKYFAILLLILVISSVVFAKINKQEKKYTIIINELNNRIIDGKFSNKFSYYYLNNNHYPVSIKEYIAWLNFKNKDEMFFYNKYMTDLFSNTNQQLVYIPIYDRKTEIPVSYILLSAGEDGKIDNNQFEKLYTNNWFEKIQAFNLNEVISQLKKTDIYYPIFRKKTKKYIYRVFVANNDDLLSNKILLKGDTLYSDSLIYKGLNPGYGAENFRLRKDSSLLKTIVGGKDYIVGFGRKSIIYQLKNGQTSLEGAGLRR